jgi:peptide/nickel transport system substrate-binding protein
VARSIRGLVAATAALALVVTACSPAGSRSSDTSTPAAPTTTSSAAATGSAAATSSATTDSASGDAGSNSAGPAASSSAGSAAGSNSQDTAAPSSSPASNLVPNSTFVIARTQDIDKLDPHVSTAFSTIATMSMVYEPLVRTDAEGKLIPALASKWDVSKDGKTITFDLRTDATWANGDPFTSSDVKASIERILDEKTAAVARSNITAITKVDTPDEHTAVLHLSAVNASILYALSGTTAAMVHDKDVTAGTIGKTPNGTGPFVWKDWTQGQQVTLTGNSHYWGGAPSIGTLQFRVIPSESSILSGMKAGAFQIGLLSDPSVAAQGEKGNGFALTKQPSTSYHTLMLNGRRPPLDNVKVRQAIACAVNRQQVVDTASFGDGTITGPITSPGYQYSPTDGLPCTPGNVDQAKQLLADGGQPNGFTLKTIVMSDAYATAVPEGQNLQSQLAAIGVKLDLQQMPTSPYVTAWLDADYDAAVARNGGSNDPYLMYGRYFTEGGSLSKPAGLESSTLNDLLVKGNSTTDETQRQPTYQQLQQQLLKESPWVWIFAEDNYYLISSKVSGFVPRADQSLDSLATTGLTG